MISRQEHRYIQISWLIIGVITVLRLWFAGGFALVPDEAYYWQWSRYLSSGYHDHPPMIAWLIFLSTTVFGHHEIAVRLPAVLCLATTSIYLMKFGQHWFGGRAALLSTILVQSILAFNAGGIIATPDSPLMAAWAGACFHIAKAYKDGFWYQWILGGIFFGLGLLSKYTMFILAPLVFAFGLWHPTPRQQLKRIWPYAGFLLGCLMFSPVVWWNIDNGWNTFRHAAHQGGVGQAAGLQLTYLLEYIGSQFGLISPLVFLLAIMTWIRYIRQPREQQTWADGFLFVTSFPVVILFAVLSLHTRVEGNWPGPAYLSAAVWIGALMSQSPQKIKADMLGRFSEKMWPWAVGLSYVLTGLIMLHVLWPIIPVSIKLDRVAKETLGWQTLARKADTLQQSMPVPQKTFIFSQSYQLASELAFYMPGRPHTVSINRWRRPNAYEYWWQDNDLKGWDAVGICAARSRNTHRLKEIFTKVMPPERIEIRRTSLPGLDRSKEPPVHEYYLYRAFGFKGGIAWQPPERGDIRRENRK